MIPIGEAQAEPQAKDDQPFLTKATIYGIGRLDKTTDLCAAQVELSMRRLIEAAIAKALKLYVEAEAKKQKLIEAHKLRMDRHEVMDRHKVMVDNHRKELASLMDRVAAVEKKGSASESSSAIKADIAY